MNTEKYKNVLKRISTLYGVSLYLQVSLRARLENCVIQTSSYLINNTKTIGKIIIILY